MARPGWAGGKEGLLGATRIPIYAVGARGSAAGVSPAGFTKRSRRWWAPNGVARVRRLNGISVTNPLESTLWSNLAGQVDSWFKTARDLF